MRASAISLQIRCDRDFGTPQVLLPVQVDPVEAVMPPPLSTHTVRGVGPGAAGTAPTQAVAARATTSSGTATKTLFER